MEIAELLDIAERPKLIHRRLSRRYDLGRIGLTRRKGLLELDSQVLSGLDPLAHRMGIPGLARVVGEIEQVPPPFSAVKVKT